MCAALKAIIVMIGRKNYAHFAGDSDRKKWKYGKFSFKGQISLPFKLEVEVLASVPYKHTRWAFSKGVNVSYCWDIFV